MSSFSLRAVKRYWQFVFPLKWSETEIMHIEHQEEFLWFAFQIFYVTTLTSAISPGVLSDDKQKMVGCVWIESSLEEKDLGVWIEE